MQKRYIIAHKDIPADYLKDEPEDKYIIVTNRDIKNESKFRLIKTDNRLDDRLWSEIACFRTILNDAADDDFICINHYRRLFECPDNQIAVAQPINVGMMNHIQYMMYHNENDIELTKKIIHQICPPDLEAEFDRMLCSQFLFPYNIINLSKAMFSNYLDVMEAILLEVLYRYHITTYETMIKHILDHDYKYIKAFAPNNTPEYQARMVSFLSERITTTYINYLVNHNVKILSCPVRLLEEGQRI